LNKFNILNIKEKKFKKKKKKFITKQLFDDKKS